MSKKKKKNEERPPQPPEIVANQPKDDVFDEIEVDAEAEESTDLGASQSVFMDEEDIQDGIPPAESVFVSSEELRVEIESVDIVDSAVYADSSPRGMVVEQEKKRVVRKSSSIRRQPQKPLTMGGRSYSGMMRELPLFPAFVFIVCVVFGLLAAFLYYAASSRAEQGKKQLETQEALIKEQRVNQQKVLEEKEALAKRLQTLEGAEKSSRELAEQLQQNLQQLSSDYGRIQEENKFLEAIDRSTYAFRVIAADNFPEVIMYTSEETGTIMLCLVLEGRPTQFRPFIQGNLRMLAVKAGNKEALKERLSAYKKLDFSRFVELMSREVKRDRKLQPHMDEVFDIAKKTFINTDEKVSAYGLYEADRATQKKLLSSISFFGEEALTQFVYLALYNRALNFLIPYEKK